MPLKKNERIQKLQELIETSRIMSRAQLLKLLYNSEITLDRDIRVMKNKGYKLAVKNGCYSIIDKPEIERKEENFSYVQLRFFSILSKFAESLNHSVSENYLCQTFVKDDELECDDRLKVTKKTLKKNLGVLMNKGIISKEKTKSGYVYRLVEDKINNGLSVDVCIKIIKFIRANIAPLPYDKSFETIAEKLENAVVQNISMKKSMHIDSAVNEIGTSYKTFSSGKDNDVDMCLRGLLDKLDRMCSQRIFAEIFLIGKEEPVRHFPLMIVYQVSSDRWYLVVKTSGSFRDFELIRVDRISHVREVPDITADEALKKRLDETKKIAGSEIERSFGTGIGQKSKIKIMIMPEDDILDSVMLRMERFKCSDMEEYEDGSVAFWIEVEGVSNFMHWVRGFGSRIIILEPDNIRKMQSETAQKVLDLYR